MKSRHAATTAAIGVTLVAGLWLRPVHADSTDALRDQRLRERHVEALERIERHLAKLAASRVDENLEDATRQLQECTHALRDNTRALERQR